MSDRPMAKFHRPQIRWYGFDAPLMTFDQAEMVLAMLKKRRPLEQVATECCVENWFTVPASDGQIGKMRSYSLPWEKAKSMHDASLFLTAKINPMKFYTERLRDIRKAKSQEELDVAASEVKFVEGALAKDYIVPLREAYRQRKLNLNGESLTELVPIEDCSLCGRHMFTVEIRDDPFYCDRAGLPEKRKNGEVVREEIPRCPYKPPRPDPWKTTDDSASGTGPT